MSALWSDNWVCSKFPAGEPAEALAAAFREREFAILGADPIVGPQRNECDPIGSRDAASKSDEFAR
jgi:hypothetical protein